LRVESRRLGVRCRTVRQAVDWARGEWNHRDFVASAKDLAEDGVAERPLHHRPDECPTSAFAYLLERESILRLGSAPGLLSTPSLDTGILLFDDLVARIRSFGSHGYRPLDLFQALLRLETVDPDRARELGGLSLPPRSLHLGRLFAPVSGTKSDGAQIVRRWIESGGGDYPDAQFGSAGLVVPTPVLTVPGPVRSAVPPALLAGHESGRMSMYAWSSTLSNTVGVVPHWPEFLSAQIEPELLSSKQMTRWMPYLASAGKAGVGVHTVIARVLAHSAPDSRLSGVDALLTLIARGAFDGAVFTATCTRLLAARELPLSRTTGSLEQIILAGGMFSIWPAVLALTHQACSAQRQPTGTSDLLALMRRFAPAARDQVLPEGIRALAHRPGSSNASTEARAIIAAAAAPARSLQ
jgi:hypothetical protein